MKTLKLTLSAILLLTMFTACTQQDLDEDTNTLQTEFNQPTDSFTGGGVDETE